LRGVAEGHGGTPEPKYVSVYESLAASDPTAISKRAVRRQPVVDDRPLTSDQF
jgi:hypothetical protein